QMSPASSVNAGRWVFISRVMVAAGVGSVGCFPAIGSASPYALSSKIPFGHRVGVPFHAYAGSLGWWPWRLEG
ncbi:hypothetical protein, partial [Actinoplanes cyaneus]|uniref:hypothetical protein n=1 Tax=Actinoplanes cyaneus TaxID=52696 RepID=UPI0019447B4B